MTTQQTWGHKETIVWPPHAPIYTLIAFALGFVVTRLRLAAPAVLRDAAAADVHDDLR